MSWIGPSVLILVVLAISIVLAVLKGKAGRSGKAGGRGSTDVPYRRGERLFSPAERSFLGVLDKVVGPAYRVFGKVRVADVATVRSGLGNSARQGALNRIAAKHFDFVVCRADDLSIVCAIELNDKSHANRKVQARDELLAIVCRTIDLPLLSVSARAAYSLEEVRALFLAAVLPPQASGSPTHEAPTVGPASGDALPPPPTDPEGERRRNSAAARAENRSVAVS